MQIVTPYVTHVCRDFHFSLNFVLSYFNFEPPTATPGFLTNTSPFFH